MNFSYFLPSFSFMYFFKSLSILTIWDGSSYFCYWSLFFSCNTLKEFCFSPQLFFFVILFFGRFFSYSANFRTAPSFTLSSCYHLFLVRNVSAIFFIEDLWLFLLSLSGFFSPNTLVNLVYEASKSSMTIRHCLLLAFWP